MAHRFWAKLEFCRRCFPFFGPGLAATVLVRTHKYHLGATVLLLLGIPLHRTLADVVTINPSQDATLIEVQPDRNNGGEQWVNAGTTQNGTRNRGLFQWDLTGVIPAGATILSADVSFEVTKVPGCGLANSSFSLYRMLNSWGEGAGFAVDNRGGQGAPAMPGEVTWNDRFFGSTPWGAPGGLAGVDFVASPSASQYIYDVGRSPYVFASGAELVGDVQTWVNDPKSNFGWMLASDDEGTPFTARRFASREDPFGRGPILTVDFELVPEPGSLALWGVGIISLLCVGKGSRMRKNHRSRA